MDCTEYKIPELLRDEIEQLLSNSAEDYALLDGKIFFVTGATGIIGYNLIHTLLYIRERLGVRIIVKALVRDIDKAKMLFGQNNSLELIKGDVRKPIVFDGKADYVIHAASITSSRMFVEAPVDVIETAVRGTCSVLDLAKEKTAERFIYLSSMEVYGTPQDDDSITESHVTDIDTMKPRSCYPESKRMCETLCTAYMHQFDVPVIVMRLTQTFGVGVKYDDPRVFAEFARCALEKKDIILHTDGGTKRNYLYTADAVKAILLAVLKGVPGEAYNVANEETYCSILDMARLVCRCCANDDIDVVIQNTDKDSFGYAPKLSMNLDCSKIRALGWKAEYDLEEMFKRLCMSMKQDRR